MIGFSLVVFGLFLDIIGAGLLALPDIPKARKRFKFGKLQQGIQLMESGGLSKNDVGFDEIDRIVRNITPVANHGCDSSFEFEEFTVNRRTGYQSREAAKSEMTWGDEYVEARRQEGELPEAVFFDTKDTLNVIHNQINSQILKFRAFGLLILLVGISLQIFGALS